MSITAIVAMLIENTALAMPDFWQGRSDAPGGPQLRRRRRRRGGLAGRGGRTANGRTCMDPMGDVRRMSRFSFSPQRWPTGRWEPYSNQGDVTFCGMISGHFCGTKTPSRHAWLRGGGRSVGQGRGRLCRGGGLASRRRERLLGAL